MDGVTYCCTYCSKHFSTLIGRSQHERKVHPEEYHSSKGAGCAADFDQIVPLPRREDDLDCVTGESFGRRDRVDTLVELGRLEGVVEEAGLHIHKFVLIQVQIEHIFLLSKSILTDY